MSPIQEVSEEEMNSLTQSILTRHGIDFTCYEPKSLRRRVIRIMSHFDLPTIHDLWLKFLRDSKFIQVFMNEISVGMTSMFRDPLLWKSIKVKMHAQYKNSDSISIWHAGCSTCEEVYTVGIILSELQMASKAKALATDINISAIEEGKQGLYHKIKMIENGNNYKQYNTYSDFSKYYKALDDRNVFMEPDLIKHVEFRYHNLITDPFPGQFDVIFCRNVMIYFDTLAKQKLIDKFYHALKPGGYFVIGYFDTLSNLIDNNLFSLEEGETRIFRKN